MMRILCTCKRESLGTDEAAYVFALISLPQTIVLFLVCDQSLSGLALTETLVLDFLTSYVVTAAIQCCDNDKIFVDLVLTLYLEAMIISPLGTGLCSL